LDHKSGQLDLASELKRKAIHLTTTFFPILYYFYLTREQICIFFVILTVFFLLAEWIRYSWPWGKNLFKLFFSPLLRENEKNRHITGATLYFISATVTFIVFEKSIAVPAVLILSVSDSLAAVVGKLTGKHKFLDKSIEGSVTFFLCSMLIMLIFTPGMHPIGMLLVSGSLTVLEAKALPVNDNLVIPVPAAIMLKLFS
jgi:dolichol kinase